MNMTAWTSEYPHIERHFLPLSTPAAGLTCRGRIDFDERSASFCRFAGELGKECRPRGICNAFRETMIMGHAVDVEVFHRNHAKRVDNLTALLVGKVLPPEGDPFMHTCNGFAMLATLWRALCQLALLTLHLCQGASDGERFHLAFDRAVIDHLDRANLGERQPVSMRETEARLRKGEASIASLAFEAGIAWLFTCAASAKEGLERQINPDRHILQDLGMNRLKRRTFLFEERIGGLLLVARQALAILFVDFLAFVQQVVVEPTALFQCLVELMKLLLGWVEPILQHFTHVSIKHLNCSVVKARLPNGSAAFIPVDKSRGLSP